MYFGRLKFHVSLEELGGKTLCCHCPRDLPCHGDVLIDAYSDRFGSPTGVAPSSIDIREAIAVKAAQRTAANKKVGAYPSVPSVFMGEGDPILVTKGISDRLLVDGGGLCSPGMWAPDKRRPTSKTAGHIRGQLTLAYASMPSAPTTS